METNWVIGQLYLGFTRNGLPVWTQPLGPGTLVYPQAPSLFPQVYQGYQQAPMSYPSLYIGNCGHAYNCLEIFEVFQPSDGTQVALACCPVCSAIQEIFDPWDSYWNYEQTPIVVA